MASAEFNSAPPSKFACGFCRSTPLDCVAPGKSSMNVARPQPAAKDQYENHFRIQASGNAAAPENKNCEQRNDAWIPSKNRSFGAPPTQRQGRAKPAKKL